MIPISPKFIIAGVATLVIGLIITLSYKHYTGLIETINELTEVNAQLAFGLEIEQQTSLAKDEALSKWQKAAEENKLIMEKLSSVAQQATAENRRLNGIFAEHDLTRLALAKPKLIENRINNGTANAGRMLECISQTNCDSNSLSGRSD